MSSSITLEEVTGCFDKHRSLIAIMLGRLEMSIEECKKAYMDMMGPVFVKKHHRIAFGKP